MPSAEDTDEAGIGISSHSPVLHYSSQKRVSIFVNRLMCDVAADYWKNGEFTNHVVVAFLQRVCAEDQFNLEPMLYQVERYLLLI